MAQYKLHCFCQSGNSYKVALYLQCAGLDWEPVLVDFFNGQTRDPKWRETVNEMGEAPVLEDGASKLAQSGVILSYLADKTGKFKPAGEAERLEALRWMLFDNHKFTGYFATYRFMKSLPAAGAGPGRPGVPQGPLRRRARHRREAPRPVASSWSATRPPSPTSRSPATCSIPPEESGYDWPKSNPNLAAWIERMRALPGWKDPYELMPGERIKPLR